MAVGERSLLPRTLSRSAVSDPSDRGPGGERDRVLDRLRILEAFEQLDRKLEQLSLQATVHLAGSAALLLDGSRSNLTRDVDALRIEYAGRRHEFESAVRQTAKDLGITPHWLNRDVSLIPGMPPRTDADERTAYQGKCLTVIAPSDRQLLAMKFRAHRQQDWGDMQILARKLGATTFEQVRDIHDRFFPHSPYSEFPDVAKEYLGREIRWLLAERGQQRSGRNLASLARKAKEPEGNGERPRSL